MISDYQLRQDVIDELDFEPSINATHIAVGVHKGVVTLSGHVASYAEKMAAESVVRRIRGVKAIAQDIEVHLPSDKKTGDDEIAQRALDILRWRVGLPAERIKVKVEHGVVTLEGAVDWQFQRTQAESSIHALTGVVGVVNLIRVASPVESSEIRGKIEKALRRSAELDASHVTVHTEGSRVILGGKVHAWYERELAERAAWAAPGVTEVQDHIDVEPWLP